MTIPRNSCSSVLLSGEDLCCMSFTLAKSGWTQSLSYIIPKNLIRGTLSSHFSLLNTSPCCFATSIKFYRFRSCSTSVFLHTTISSAMLTVAGTLFKDLIHSMLEHILAHHQPEWDSQETISSKWTIKSCQFRAVFI